MSSRSIVTLLISLLFGCGSAFANVYVIDQGGGGDFTTIAAAAAAVESGATLKIMPGIYDEYVNITRSLNIIADAGEGTVILEGGGTHQLFNIEAPVEVSLTKLIFQNARVEGEAGVGAAVHGGFGAIIHVNHCDFIGNWAGWDTGGLWAQGNGTTIDAASCRFENNYAFHNCPAAGVALNASMTLTDCEFINNTCPNIGGCVSSWYADLTVNGCLFVGNHGGTAGALRLFGGTADVVSNTFHDNSGEAVVVAGGMASFVFSYNIITTNPIGVGLAASDPVNRSCNLIYDVEDHPAVPPTRPIEIHADPLYCDYENGDFTLCSLSPALAENNSCGSMGAFGQGCVDCGPVSNDRASWGEIKSIYR
jgi:hypothetical protein